MTPTPHGKVPEALIDLIDAYAETRHRYGGIYNAKTEVARKAVIEALSGVQALSAAPAVPTSVKGAMWFTKKPVTIQAIQWTGENLREVITFTDGPPDTRSHHAGMAWDAYRDLVARDGLKIYTLEGKMLASPGDWIIRGVKGEMYPCKDEIFRLTYEPVGEVVSASCDHATVRWLHQTSSVGGGDPRNSRAWPKVSGVNRDEGHSRALLVFFAAEPTDDEMRAVHDTLAASPTPPAEQQAAPKAVPGEQNTVPAEWLEQAYREGWAACRDAETIGEEAEDWAFGNSTANSRMIDAQQAAPQPAPHLPERDASLPAERQGLFRKFVVGRVDGSDKPGGKHHGCTYFVLDVDHDPCARPALAAYAAACESTHPTLAADLRTKWGVVPAPQPSPAPLSDAQIAEMMRDTWGCASIAPRHAETFARAIEAEVRKQDEALIGQMLEVLE